MQPLRPTDVRSKGAALRYRHQTKPSEDTKKSVADGARKQLETVQEFEENESLQLSSPTSSRPESANSNVSGVSRYSAQRQFTINAKPVPKNAEPETSSGGLLPLLPLILALLPAAVAILAGETAGVFVTDSLLLVAVGWVMWSMREGSWRLYTFRLEQSPDQSATIPLMLFMATPFAGAAVMRFARDQLSAGSHLVTNFNIFLYVTLETARGVSKLAVHSAPSIARQKGDESAENESAKKIQRLEYELETVQAQLNGLGRRVIDNESVLHSELYTVWRNMDQMTENISQIDHTGSDSTSRAKMKQLMSPGIPESLENSTSAVLPAAIRTKVDKTPTRRTTTTAIAPAKPKHKSSKSQKEKIPDSATTSSKNSIEDATKPSSATGVDIARSFWANRTATYQQHSIVWWPIATVWNMALYLMLLLPFQITHRVFTTAVSTARRLLELPRRSIGF